MQKNKTNKEETKSEKRKRKRTEKGKKKKKKRREGGKKKPSTQKTSAKRLVQRLCPIEGRLQRASWEEIRQASESVGATDTF